MRITSMTRDLSLGVVRVSAPRIPTTFYVVDLRTAKRLLSMPAYPGLRPGDLSPTDPIELKVRDGLTIRGFLTTPKGKSGRNLPLIVLVHGGPHDAHDSFDFDPEVQLLASRGYAVLQVNYRGSNGRGRAFMRAGYGRWGREMQDDVTDAVKWAIAASIADRSRICIYGAGFGAYAALNGAAREPQTFKCAVGMSGFYDLALMYERADRTRDQRTLEYLRQAIGTDGDEWERRSPVNGAAKIAARVMLIHGSGDEREPVEQALRMREALLRTGNVPVWVAAYVPDKGERDDTVRVDFFGPEKAITATVVAERREAHRLGVYEQLLTFFARHLDTNVESSGEGGS